MRASVLNEPVDRYEAIHPQDDVTLGDVFSILKRDLLISLMG
jgi:hypothetical protein